jgi:hypothetical protein
MRRVSNRTPSKRKKFLDALAQGTSVSGAAMQARISRKSCYDWRRDDPVFAKDWDEAIEAGTDALEDEMIRRAKTGILRAIYQGGRRVGVERIYSDSMAMFLVQARRPEKYRPKTPDKEENNKVVIINVPPGTTPSDTANIAQRTRVNLDDA